MSPFGPSKLLPCLALLVLLSSPAPASIIVNGDFESGNTGFMTQYTRVPGNIGGQRTYDVLTNPFPAHPSAASYGDHTSGAGLMMAVNEATMPGFLVWGQTVAVQPGADYAFSAFISSWVSAAPSQLDVLFNGASVGTMLAPSQTAVWVQFTAGWKSGAAASLTIELRNKTSADVGGDFALDDVSLTGPAAAVPEPSGLAPFLAAVGAAGLAWLRRKSSGTTEAK